MLGVGDVPDDEDVGIAAAHPGIHQDTAAVGLHIRGFGEFEIRNRARSDEHDVGVDPLPASESHTRRGTVVDDDLLHPDPGAQGDALLPVQVDEDLRDFGSERTGQGHVGLFDDGHLAAPFLRRGRDLQSDPPTADGHHALPLRPTRCSQGCSSTCRLMCFRGHSYLRHGSGFAGSLT